MIAYQAEWVCPATSQPTRHATLLVENGRVAGIGSEAPANAQCVKYPGCVIVPGFVNAHTHLELTLFDGLLEKLSFPDWIARLVRMKYEQCTPDAMKLSAQLGAIGMLHAGITTVGEVMDTGTGWEAMLEFGLQGVAFQEVFGPADEASAQALSGLREKVGLRRQRETPTQRIGVSPHAPYTVSKRLFEGVRDYARNAGLRMTTHIAESEEESLFVRDGSGTFAARHHTRNIPVVARHCLPIAYLDQLGLLGPDMLLVHAIEAEAPEILRMRDTGTFVVHCPKSNAFLRHRIARVAEMRAHDVHVALGTDSAASNDSIDMFGEMRMAQTQQRLSFEEVFGMATIEGARALGLGDSLGSLEAGKRADFAVVEVRDAGMDPLEDMVCYGRPGDVRATFVGGKEVVVDDGSIREELERFLKDLRI